MEKRKGKVNSGRKELAGGRPALALLDQLNQKLQVDNNVLVVQQENATLKAENKQLKSQQAQL